MPLLIFSSKWVGRAPASLLHGWICLLVLSLQLMSGCAQQPSNPEVTEEHAWNGRIALQVEDQSSQSFSAMFELHGNAQIGGLVLLSPLGSRIAQLDWTNGHAQLQSGQETRHSDSLDGLLQEMTGTRIPVEALFSWLQGKEAAAAGWQADLSGIPNGRLIAQRDDPTPRATLRIALTR